MTDYTAAFLAQLTDLQTRLTKQDATISMLKAEVDRLKENSKTGPVMRMSVPLNRHDARDNRQVRDVRDVRDVFNDFCDILLLLIAFLASSFI